MQVCMNGVWSSVCDWRWDYKDAFVICRQLGYPATGENNGMDVLVHAVSSVSVFGPCMRLSFCL